MIQENQEEVNMRASVSRRTAGRVQATEKSKQKFRNKPKEEGKRESILGAATVTESQINV